MNFERDGQTREIVASIIISLTKNYKSYSPNNNNHNLYADSNPGVSKKENATNKTQIPLLKFN